MVITNYIKKDYIISLFSWRKNYYVGRYSTFPFDPTIVEILCDQITFEEFQSISHKYPIIKIQDDVLFEAGKDIEHILKIRDADLGRLEAEEAEKIYQFFADQKILFDIRNRIRGVKTSVY